MSAAVVYDQNFSVPLHIHRADPQSLFSGDAIICATCGKDLIIVCPDGCDGALDEIRYSKGPVPAAPAREEKPRRRFCRCGNKVEPYKQLCEPCREAKRRATSQRRCPCGAVIEEKSRRYCASCRQAKANRPVQSRTVDPTATTKICRTCHIEQPIGQFEKVWGPYTRADCRTCRKVARQGARAIT